MKQLKAPLVRRRGCNGGLIPLKSDLVQHRLDLRIRHKHSTDKGRSIILRVTGEDTVQLRDVLRPGLVASRPPLPDIRLDNSRYNEYNSWNGEDD